MAGMSNGLALHSSVSLIKQPEIISTTNIFLSDNNIRISQITLSLTNQKSFLSLSKIFEDLCICWQGWRCEV